MATDTMLRDAHDLMTCAHCLEPVILTVEDGLCPRCFYKLECEAICAAAAEEVDRVLTEMPSSAARAWVPAAAEPAWSW